MKKTYTESSLVVSKNQTYLSVIFRLRSIELLSGLIFGMPKIKAAKVYFALFAVLFSLFFQSEAFSTHNRAGEITFEHIGGLQYRITVTTYTKASSCQADRCELEIRFGDGVIDTIKRTNGPNCPITPGCPEDNNCSACGELITNEIKKNVYSTIHSYNGPGIFKISVEDPNRNSGIKNIQDSENVIFYIESQLIIYPGNSFNSSPVLTNPPIDNGCAGLPFSHNPGAVDAEGDSLTYSLVTSKGMNGDPISTYTLPNANPACPGGSLTINPLNGTLIWDSPQCQGTFNFAILITEWRKGVKIGTVLRDMQVFIESPCPNNPPNIQEVKPLCVVAGDTVDVTLQTKDPNLSDFLTFNATGELFNLPIKPAKFISDSGTSPVYTRFYWETSCNHVRINPYNSVIKADDNHPLLNLVDFETIEVTVIAPPINNPKAQPFGNSIELTWEASTCSNASCYRIYRKIDSLGFKPDSCVTGVPAYTGYQFIGSTEGLNSTTFTDNSPNLVLGQKYCYMVVACFQNGAQSIASEEFCAELKKELPIITNVSVITTDNTFGVDSIIWSTPTELDTLNNPLHKGPYHYEIYRSKGFGSATDFVGKTLVSTFLGETDTIWENTGLDTKNTPYSYKIALYSDTFLVGYSQVASSVFLSSQPTDNQLNLSWTASVPWSNYEYLVYKQNNAGVFNEIAKVTEPKYEDKDLLNGKEYCYYIKSVGKYSTTDIISPLYNKSQIHCNIPVDNIPPCEPDGFSLSSICTLFENQLQWNNPLNTCADDVIGYKIYYSPKFGSEFTHIYTVNEDSDTVFLHQDLNSVAGCYAVTAIDTFFNESPLSDTACAENCPTYELPNIFTPGGDGFNDFFQPFPYRYVQSIDLKIYNRWGEIVHQNNDPDILWNGLHDKTKRFCNSGVYYYVCTVHEIKLKGIESRIITGYFHLLWEGDTPNQPTY